MAEEIVNSLCSDAKIERDRAVLNLQKNISSTDINSLSVYEDKILEKLGNLSSSWESRQGCLLGSIALIQNDNSNCPCSDTFVKKVQEHALHMLEDSESRVRLSAGETMKALCRKLGTDVYVTSREKIIMGVKGNLERQTLKDEELIKINEKLLEKITPSETHEDLKKDASQIFHDTAGWKSLETWMKCLQFVVEGCGQDFNRFIDQHLLDLIFQSLEHTNRFVRETGYQVCGAIVNCASKTDDGKPVLTSGNSVHMHGDQFAKMLANGLADNWSQVRLAASLATRNFLQSMPDEVAREKFYPQLIPRMCLNRYYVAEGVRLFSQETWRQVTGGSGKKLVETYITEVVEFYISQTEADNHAVREAACACIAELGSKINKEAVKPYVKSLLDALLICFKDDSWPVRDASCVACGNFILCFPQESAALMSSLYPLFFENLQDNIPSVRQGAASSLCNVCKAYGPSAVSIIVDKIKSGLKGIEQQPPDAQKYSNLDTSPAVYGVAKRARDNDMELHSNMPMYSCGSLAPKMGRGKRSGGCMDHQFRRPSQPWELADGCVYLIAELSSLQSESEKVALLLPLMAKAASLKTYACHVTFLETVCKVLPTIAKGIGKRYFKPNVEAFFDPIFYGLSGDNALTSSAASQCLNQLSSFLGPNILRGRVEQYNPKYLEQLDATQYIAAL